ncbi:type I toxin-antitoxin system SymE family toxin, partial [Escherichia coli]|nr:type I toxin-antitoxin system SymE family toxin [Escherichia coli]
MAEHDITPEVTISKTQRRYKVGYVRARHQDRKTGIARYYSQHPSMHLKCDHLHESGFDSCRSVECTI